MSADTAAPAAKPSRDAGASSTRLSVNINARTANDLRRLAQSQNITYTEAVRRAVEVLAFLTDEREAGNAIQVVDPKNKTTREIITL
ncbi:hypothetical protein GCM10009633_23830 [Janibacter melonis]|uniref:CopG family transcriptional regulator n=1 Tax=Janibacter melonis TaxID=262209 RepID=UPI001E462A82|nr:CopG family transcriptional regulator [Janibacter melonis]MCB5993212.1 CopG family transcriptional regulator [Janibacter melonis]